MVPPHFASSSKFVLTLPHGEAIESRSLSKQRSISAVIPVFNEDESLRTLHSELAAVSESHNLSLEIIFVDDGSSDDSWSQIESMSEEDDRVQGIRFRRNFGKAAALNAGFAAATGDIVVTLDADLQDDPKEIPRFLERMDEGFDVVSGWKKVRHDPFHKRYPSKVFNGLVGWLTGVKLHDHNCGFKSYQREIFDEIRLYGELHRFVPVLAAARGWRVGEIVVEHRARKFGKSKYGFTRFVKGFLDLLTVYFLTGYRNRPQHLLGTAGLISFLLGSLGMFYLAVYWIIRITSPGLQESWPAVHERPLLIYAVGAMLLGAQLLSIGFLAELITANDSDPAANYSVRSRTGSRLSKKSKAEATTTAFLTNNIDDSSDASEEVSTHD